MKVNSDQSSWLNMKQFLLLPLLVLLISSCGEDAEEKIKTAITEAHELMTQRRCDEAITSLNKVGYQNNNPDYLQAYASSYACKGNFSIITFFETDLAKISATDGGILGSLTTFTTSETTSIDEGTFVHMQTAIDTLLYAGGATRSSSTLRRSAFGESTANNIDVQALYFILAQMGKYFYFLGNPSEAGAKGGGTGTNQCLTDYTVASAQGIRALLSAAGKISPCASDDDGPEALASSETEASRREVMCKGVVLFNNFLDIISNITFTGSNTGALGNLSNLTDFCTNPDADSGLGAGISAALCATKTQSECETDSSITIELLEQYFTVVFEVMFTDA